MIHAKHAKKDAENSKMNFAVLCDFTWRPLREIW